MNNVVAFLSPMSDERTPVAVEVIVAPLAELWVAWLHLPNGHYVALERTPDQDHAVADARAYAKRHGTPVSWRSVPLAVALKEPPPSQPGEIGIWPDMENGGSWLIDHTSASGDSAAIIGNAFSLDEAIRIAREAARRLGATFDEQSGAPAA